MPDLAAADRPPDPVSGRGLTRLGETGQGPARQGMVDRDSANPVASDIRMPGAIEQWPIGRVLGYQQNPRIHTEAEVQRMAAAMTRFGVTKPIEVDEAGVILCGHRRLRAAQLLGLKEVPVLVHRHLSDAEKRAYRISDNRLGLEGEW